MYNVNIRGAITVEHNDKEEILQAAKELLKELMLRNKIGHEDISYIIFSVTKDLTKVYPAVAARDLGIKSAALMCLQEMDVEDSLEKCIRVMVGLQSEGRQEDARHVYLRGARALRPDIVPVCAVAVDGPVGSGKSSAARLAAKALGFIYIDTGAMYRAAALYCMKNNVNMEDEGAVEEALPHINIEIRSEKSGQEIYLNGENVTDTIRTQPVAEGSSKVAVMSSVRDKLVSLQREMAKSNSVVMDGRDIGTVVLPEAQVKIYMDANLQVRTARRIGELEKKGIKADFEQTLKEIEERDYRDMNRAHSPLRKAEDAIYLDTSYMELSRVVSFIADTVKTKGLS